MKLVFLERCGSTNDEAFRLHEKGSALAVYTFHQACGRGSRGRSWEMAPGQGLAISYVFDQNLALPLATVPLATGVAAVETLMRLKATESLDVRLKWPNDLLLEEGKLAGILCEARWMGSQCVVVAGLGLNVFGAPATGQSTRKAISLVDRAGPLPFSWLESFVQEFLRELEQLASRPSSEVIQNWWRYSWRAPGASLSFSQAEIKQRGVLRGLDDCGRLLLETSEGVVALDQPTIEF
jgi:BirA family biotin operon repressor/biotin-[acetyl-CoA-carboxylase] ligase